MASLARRIQKKIMARKGVEAVPVVCPHQDRAIGFALPLHAGQTHRLNEGL